ncbi:MAG: hypothetical protein ABEK59_12020 [Halobacteria archaeon]
MSQIEALKQTILDKFQESSYWSLGELATEVDTQRAAVLYALDELGANEYGPYFHFKQTKPRALPSDPDNKIKQDLKRERRLRRYHQQRADSLLQDWEKAQQMLDLQETEAPQPGLDLRPAKVVEQAKRNQTIPLVTASDWHIGEKVDPDTVRDNNDFHLDIAKQRMEEYFNQVYDSLKFQSQRRYISNAVLWLGGDLISNYLHEELQESNSLTPQQEVQVAEAYLKEGLRYLNELGLEWDVVCSFGNHGRLHKVKRHSTGAYNNFEFFLYQNLREKLSDLENFRWHIPASTDYVLELFPEFRVRFQHGDMINGGKKDLAAKIDDYQKNKNHHQETQKVHYDVLGHFHQYLQTRNFLVNGSLVGTAAFAYNGHFPIERPKQGLQFFNTFGEVESVLPVLL